MIIFLGGIHGAGKGTIAKTLSEKVGLDHFIASEILKWEEFSPNLQNKNVESILSTQEKLLLGLEEIKTKKTSFILDGHFCLFNKRGKFERIPYEIFEAISPSIISVVVEDIAIVCERIWARDKREYDSEKLGKMQEEEVRYSREIAKSLSIPHVSIMRGNLSSLLTLINKFL